MTTATAAAAAADRAAGGAGVRTRSRLSPPRPRGGSRRREDVVRRGLEIVHQGRAASRASAVVLARRRRDDEDVAYADVIPVAPQAGVASQQLVHAHAAARGDVAERPRARLVRPARGLLRGGLRRSRAGGGAASRRDMGYGPRRRRAGWGANNERPATTTANRRAGARSDNAGPTCKPERAGPARVAREGRARAVDERPPRPDATTGVPAARMPSGKARAAREYERVARTRVQTTARSAPRESDLVGRTPSDPTADRFRCARQNPPSIASRRPLSTAQRTPNTRRAVVNHG